MPSIAPLRPWTVALRTWQEAAFHQFLAHSVPDFLLMATPGAGKTRFALRVAHRLLEDRIVRRLIVVCPTNHLRQQWADAAHQVGIQLDPRFDTAQGREAADYHGAVVTFQQVCSEPTPYRLAVRRVPTLAIFDELHHAADGKQWASALRKAFELAERRLALSGTPFRSDNLPIPFVTYRDNQSVADFRYGYAESLSDGVCRPVIFPSYEGEISWLSHGRHITARFQDGLQRQRRRERLKTALLQTTWLGPVLRDADAELERLRAAGDPSAGGLVVTMDQAHAADVARQLTALTGRPARVAVSDDPDASRTITRFAHSRDRWLVAVNMVSEGVDIPRLRVGVYTSNVLTEMYFRQVVGRLVRMQLELPPSQRAYLYIPGDPTLVEYALAIKAERDHVLLDEWHDAPQRTLFSERGANASETYLPLHAVAKVDARIGDDEAMQDEDINAEVRVPRHIHKEQLRMIHRNLVGRIARQAGLAHRVINSELIRRTGSRIESATIKDLEMRIRQLERWIDRGYDGR